MKKILAFAICLIMLVSMTSFSAAAVGDVTVTSCKVLNSNQIEITFSEPVKLVGSVFSAIRYTNDKYGLQKDETKASENGYLHWYGSLTADGSNKMIWTMSTAKLDRVLADVLSMKGYEDKGYKIYFCFEGLEIKNATNLEGYVDNIQTADGSKMLKANLPKKDGIYDGLYVPITETENVATEVPGGTPKPKDFSVPEVPEAGPEGKVTITACKVLNKKEIEFTFSEPVTRSGNTFNGIRYTNNDMQLIKDEEALGKSGYLQFEGSMRINGSNKAIFTLADKFGNGLTRTMEEILNFKGYEDKGYKIYFCFEGLEIKGKKNHEGYVDNIRSLDAKKLLEANKPSKGGIYDGLYVEITDTQNATKDYPKGGTALPKGADEQQEQQPDGDSGKDVKPADLTPTADGIKITSCKVINERQLELTFSDKVEYNGRVFSGIRYTNAALALMTDKSKADPHLQFIGSLALDGTNKGTFTYKESLKDILNLKGYQDKGYQIYFCIEGLPNDNIKNPKTGYIENIQSPGGKKFLASNKPSPTNVYDGYYVPITDVGNVSIKAPSNIGGGDAGGSGSVAVKDRPYITIDSCRVLNSVQLELTFSEEAVRASSVFAAIRYTNDKKSVIRLESGDYLQWSGSLNIEGKRGIWTLSDSTGKTLQSLIAMEGYENAGYELYFCIEGLPTDTAEPGYIDNIKSKDGKKLLKASNPSGSGIYDGLYLVMEDTDNAEGSGGMTGAMDGITVDSIVPIDDYKLELTFSEPIYLIGEGTAATQYSPVSASISFVDPNTYDTVEKNGVLLQYPGDFYAEDGSDKATFELRNHAYTIKQLFDKEGYDEKDTSLVVLCIEGTEDYNAIPSPQMGFVDNVQNADGTKMLMAAKMSISGVSDVWFGTAEQIDFDSLINQGFEFGIEDNTDDENEPVSGDNTGDVTDETESNGIPVWVWGVVGGVIVIAAAIVAIVLSKKKKK